MAEAGTKIYLDYGSSSARGAATQWEGAGTKIYLTYGSRPARTVAAGGNIPEFMKHYRSQRQNG